MFGMITTAKRWAWAGGLVLGAGIGSVGGVASGEAVTLKPTLEVGDTIQQRFTMSQSIDQRVMGRTMKMQMDASFDMTIRVQDVPEEGAYRLEVTYDRVEAEVDGPMGPGKWRSEDDGMPQNPMLLGFAAMDGMVLAYDLSATGEVSNLEGHEVMMEKMLEQLPEAMRPQLAVVLEQALGKDQMLQMVEAGHAMYPDGPVSEGETWTKSQALGGMLPLVVESAYTVTSIDADAVSTDLEGTLETAEGATLEMMPGMSMEMSMSGTQSGQVVFDRETGWVKRMEISQQIDGEMSTTLPENAGGMAGQEMVVPMKVDGTVTLEMLD